MSAKLFEQLQSLLPPVSYDPAGQQLSAQLTSEANALQEALDRLEQVESAIFPESAGSYISDWERVYGITPAPGATQDQRVQAVLAAMGDMGGQSIPYFIRLALLFGVRAKIRTFKTPVVGRLSAGDPLYAGDWIYTWQVDSPLPAYRNAPMEARLSERRPANTDVVFGYGKEVVDEVVSAVDSLFDSVNYVLPTMLS
ncbi:DUF2313 domain-containing protein [Pseudomonas putida]|uniref:DUF2313 domain-containing protein n=1 Tax=Pseudomonas putida TaxID=303 RepID=A0A7D5VWN4_PSEPU|nr:putative phage tail protein [Pseudomonas putida]QLJ12746.1 DUF2313 domain-containing protein [Pseudomonas putida]